MITAKPQLEPIISGTVRSALVLVNKALMPLALRSTRTTSGIKMIVLASVIPKMMLLVLPKTVTMLTTDGSKKSVVACVSIRLTKNVSLLKVLIMYGTVPNANVSAKQKLMPTVLLITVITIVINGNLMYVAVLVFPKLTLSVVQKKEIITSGITLRAVASVVPRLTPSAQLTTQEIRTMYGIVPNVFVLAKLRAIQNAKQLTLTMPGVALRVVALVFLKPIPSAFPSLEPTMCGITQNANVSANKRMTPLVLLILAAMSTIGGILTRVNANV